VTAHQPQFVHRQVRLFVLGHLNYHTWCSRTDTTIAGDEFGADNEFLIPASVRIGA
jgi:hypothetical protein